MKKPKTPVVEKPMDYANDKFAHVECFVIGCRGIVEFDGDGSKGACLRCGQIYIRNGNTALLND